MDRWQEMMGGGCGQLDLDHKWSVDELVDAWSKMPLPPMVRVRLLRAVGAGRKPTTRIVGEFGAQILERGMADVTAIGAYETFAKENPSTRQIEQLKRVLELRFEADPKNYAAHGALRLIKAVQTRSARGAFIHLEYAAGVAAVPFTSDHYNDVIAHAVVSDVFIEATGYYFRKRCFALQKKGELD